MLLTGLAPLVGSDPTVLILGSMPSERSLEARRYYAQPTNRFWRLMSDVVGFPRDAGYEVGTAALVDGGFALWDVLKHCFRVGSLDSSIVRASEVPNDLASFLAAHPAIGRVVLNGRTAERAFREHVAPTLGEGVAGRLEILGLPSTSAANARWRYAELLEVWSGALRGSGPPA